MKIYKYLYSFVIAFMVSSLFVAPTVGASVNWATHTVTVSSSILNALSAEISDNNVTNPTFTTDINGWSVFNITTSHVTQTMNMYKSSITGTNEYIRDTNYYHSCTPGEDYIYSADIKKLKSTGTGALRLYFYNSNSYVTNTTFYLDNGTHDWKNYQFEFTMPTNANQCTPLVAFLGLTAGTEAEWYIDNIKLQKKINSQVEDFSYLAVTDLYHISNIYMVSLAGLSSSADPGNWSITEALWLGTAAVADDYSTAAIEGTETYEAMTQGVVYDDWGGDDSTPLFPWESGRMAYFGTRAVHDAGYGLDGWQAVDWVSGPSYGTNFYQNGIYASEDAQITYVCRDDTSVAVRAGNFLYAHLADNSTLQQGYKLRKGVKFAELVPGSFTDTCGWAAQQPDSYHIHWGFYASGGKLVIEDWTLDTASSTWSRGNQTVHVGDAMLSTGTSYPENGEEENGDYEASLDGSHFWDSPINSIITFVTKKIIPRFPEGESRQIGKTYMNSAGVAIRIFYVLLKSNFSLGIFVFVFVFISFLEPVRLMYALYRLVKDAIPGA